MPMTAFAPCSVACCSMSYRASSRVFSHISSKIVMLPPTIVCSDAPRFPRTLRERTVTPRTSPRFLTTRYPGKSNAFDTIAASAHFSCTVAWRVRPAHVSIGMRLLLLDTPSDAVCSGFDQGCKTAFLTLFWLLSNDERHSQYRYHCTRGPRQDDACGCNAAPERHFPRQSGVGRTRDGFERPRTRTWHHHPGKEHRNRISRHENQYRGHTGPQ